MTAQGSGQNKGRKLTQICKLCSSPMENGTDFNKANWYEIRLTHTCSRLLLFISLFLISGTLPCRTEQDVSLPGNKLLNKRVALPFNFSEHKTTRRKKSRQLIIFTSVQKAYYL